MNKTFILRSESVLSWLNQFLRTLPLDGSVSVKVGEVTRNMEQNAMMWSLLECFSQQLKWPVNGAMVKLESEEWKDILSAAFRNETQRVAMGLNGGMVMLGMRTSKMGKKEFSEFIEFILAIGAERGVEFGQERMAA